MSRTRIDFRDRKVVMSVLVVVAAVFVLNWRVFGPMRARRARINAQQEDMPLVPADLQEMAGMASARLFSDPEESNVRDHGVESTVFSGRDPFHQSEIEAVDEVQAPKIAIYGLTCSAVLPDGDHPTAVINGIYCHPGDKIQGYTVESIDSKGVRLSSRARKILLPVNGPARSISYRPPVTE